MSTPSPPAPPPAGGGLGLARDFLWNLSAGGWSVLVALLATPYVVGRLGVDAYGAYALLGVLLSYFKFTELGLSRAVERHVAASRGAGRPEQARRYYRTALTLQLGLATLVGALVALAGPLLLGFFEIPADQVQDTRLAIRIVALSMVLNFIGGLAEALLRSHRRFPTLSRIAVTAQTTSTLLLVAGVTLRPTVVVAVTAALGGNILRFLLLFAAARRVPGGRLGLAWHRDALTELLSFGGSLTLANLVAPFLVNAEKLLLAALLGTASLTHYIVPFRVLSRFSLVSGSLGRALFPRLSDLEGKARLADLYRTATRATAALAWLLLPVFTTLALAGDRLLALWMGEDFASAARGVVPWLVAGTLLNLLAANAVGVIQARGRPGLLAWLYLAELLFYLPTAWWLMTRWGATGAAIAWTLRVAVDTLALWGLAAKLTGVVPRPRLRPAHGLAVATLAVGIGLESTLPGLARLGSALVAGLVMAAVSWWGGFPSGQRDALLAEVRRRWHRFRARSGPALPDPGTTTEVGTMPLDERGEKRGS